MSNLFEELFVFLPCHSLEDFPTHHEGADADSLLASWTSLWHPQLIALTGKAPTWKRVDDPPQTLGRSVIVVPAPCVSRLPTGYAQRIKDSGGVVIRKTASRSEIWAAALPTDVPQTLVQQQFADDFASLGLAYLLVQLLTRQMRYSSNLDETYFQSLVMAAAEAAANSDESLAREKLGAAFSLLAEERDHYYPVGAYILEVAMVAPSVFGSPLVSELSEETPKNILISGSQVEALAKQFPATLTALKQAISAKTGGLLGGTSAEPALPLLSLDDLLAELQLGRKQYKQHLDKFPEVFASWRFALTPNLPGILQRLGYSGALHSTFDEGKVPVATQLKVRWEGLDNNAIDAISRAPLDAQSAQTFLQLATRLGESMDQDHVATLLLAYWPGQQSQWLADLRRIAKWTTALGKFVTVEEYFSTTALPGTHSNPEPDRYRTPYLKQAVIRKQADPVSAQVRYQNAASTLLAQQAMHALSTSLGGEALEVPAATPLTSSPLPDCESTAIDSMRSKTLEIASDAAKRFAYGGDANRQGTMVLNPHSFVRRTLVTLPESTQGLPEIGRPIYAATEISGTLAKKVAVVDVPAMGFVWVPSKNPSSKVDPKAPSLAEGNVLRNEFFEATINPITGTLKSFNAFQARGNRLSQQLALRTPGAAGKPGDSYTDPDLTATYSVMAADKVEVTTASSVVGEITATGRLLDLHGKVVARFEQVYRAVRGSRVLRLSITIKPEAELKSDPWASYFCCRFAWADDMAELFHTCGKTRSPITAKRFDAPHYIEIQDAKTSTTILTGGVNFHRRHDDRMLDSILIPRGETSQTFTMGIGLDLTHPILEALALNDGAEPIVIPNIPCPTSGNSGWLFHLDSKNVVATAWSPCDREGKNLPSGGKSPAGMRVRILETAGRPANLSLTGFKTFQEAYVTDLNGQKVRDLEIEGGKVRVEMGAHEWLEIVAIW